MKLQYTETKVCLTHRVDIYMAGNYEQAKQVCREFCIRGLCVHIEPCDYIYTGGEEAEFKVGLINYPRFPNELDNLMQAAVDLAEDLMVKLCQTSFTIVDPNVSHWFSRRKDVDNK